MFASMVAVAKAHAQESDTLDDKALTVLLGPGVQHMPAWIGAENMRNQPVPFVYIDWPDHFTLSTVDGANLDLIGGPKLHGGLYGNYLWGRERNDLGPRLEGKIDTLSPRLQAGGYIEYQLSKPFSFGANLSHDTQGAGAYLNIYADLDLPKIGYMEHSVELQWQGMNGPAMRRFFGLTPAQAQALGVQPWSPTGGTQGLTFTYSAFIPTSVHTGFALSLEYTRLLGDAADSPLIREYGSADQLTTSLSFVWRM
ncbi:MULTISPECIES: MipA/OmpV family protein [Dyella]|nr:MULTISPECIES: MipA/OmpV family protein [Dyella]